MTEPDSTNPIASAEDRVESMLVIDPAVVIAADTEFGSEADTGESEVIDPERDPSANETAEGADVPRRRSFVRRGLKIAAVLVLLGLVYYAVNLFQVWHVGRSDQARRVDAIVVMGAAQYDGRPSPQLEARLDQVLVLWNRGLAPLVVVTGGKQPGDRFTEAGASAAYLEKRGVPSTAIVMEDQGHSSWQSLSTVSVTLDQRGVKTVLMVSDPYHSLRIRLMAEELGFMAYVSPTRTSPVVGATAFGRELKEAAGVAVGRIIGFDRLLSITG